MLNFLAVIIKAMLIKKDIFYRNIINPKVIIQIVLIYTNRYINVTATEKKKKSEEISSLTIR